jgi:hypothetical protein
MVAPVSAHLHLNFALIKFIRLNSFFGVSHLFKIKSCKKSKRGWGSHPIAVNLSFYKNLYFFDNERHGYFFAHSFGEQGCLV